MSTSGHLLADMMTMVKKMKMYYVILYVNTHLVRLLYNRGDIREVYRVSGLHVLLPLLQVLRLLDLRLRHGNGDLFLPPLVDIAAFLLHLLQPLNLFVRRLAPDVVAFRAVVASDLVFAEIGPRGLKWLYFRLLC